MKVGGFTLIELLLVVAIILVLSALSSTFYSRFLLQNAVDNGVDQVVGSLRKAQIYSMESKWGDNWSVNFNNNTIVLYKGLSFAGRDHSFDETFSVNSNVAVLGLDNISFARGTGLPSSTATITVAGNGQNKVVNLNSQGMVER